jgi:hypothetical protein
LICRARRKADRFDFQINSARVIVLGLSLRITTLMTSTVAHASPRVDALRAAHPTKMAATLERQLARFSQPYSQRVRVLAARHPRLADLALSFPALLFALAAPRRNFNPAPVIERVIDGARLAELSQLAGVPNWMRKLHPEAFVRPLSARLPNGDLFRRQIANHLPKPKTAAKWLHAVTNAADWGTEPMAVWVAREMMRKRKRCTLFPDDLRVVCLWAWYCGRPLTFGQTLANKLWHPSMSASTAIDLAKDWRERVELQLNLTDQPIPDMWLQAAVVDGYLFTPLQTAREIKAEAEAMSNCITSFGDKLARNWARLWSVSKDGSRVATLQAGHWSNRDPLLQVTQLLGASNNKVPEAVWWAARKWINNHDLLGITVVRKGYRDSHLDRTTWVMFWRPYWLEKRHLPEWLPLSPSRPMLDAI